MRLNDQYHPDIVELTCPCCDSYIETSKETATKLRLEQRTVSTDNQILCSECWRVFLKVMKRFTRKESKT